MTNDAERVKPCPIVRWAALWHSKNKRDGVAEHILFHNLLPVLFRTRADARVWINKRYGYIKDRKDLRVEPHGWRLPRPIRVTVNITPGAME